MYKLVTLASLVLVFLLAPTASARHCPKLYSVSQARSEVHRVYGGSRPSSAASRALIWAEVTCQRNPRAVPYVKWYLKDQRNRWIARHRTQFTGYVVSGRVSTFGPPAEGGSQTADGGNDSRPCIALRDGSTLGRWFLVTIAGHSAKLLHCDSGPYAGGRSIDVTGDGAYAMGLSPYNFPTDSWGVARELR